MDRPEFPRRDVLGAVALGAGVAGCLTQGGGERVDDGANGDDEGSEGNEGAPDAADGSDGEGADADPSSGDAETVVVGPGGAQVFDPESLGVEPGTTVVWEWDSDFHNVVVDSQPEESEWEGQAVDETYDTGYEYEHTFEVEGTYEYYCQPHRAQGMAGTIHVDAESRSSAGHKTFIHLR